LVLQACGGGTGDHKRQLSPDKSTIEDVNRYLVQKDRERIENYIERKQLRMEMSPTGLWFQIVNEGVGDKIAVNDIVSFEYRCDLLDGTEIYSSEESGPKRIRIGQTDIERGLDEGLRMLRNKGEARFIIPSYLAHGLIGDGNRIPARAILVYDVKVLSHNNN
jgi:FKBP-type peptidyl-prolyl cis-trans isomerase